MFLNSIKRLGFQSLFYWTIKDTLLLPLLETKTLKLLSTAIPVGLNPTTDNILETPSGVILLTLLSNKFGVYKLPKLSIAIPIGEFPVVAKIVDTPSGVIFVILSDPLFVT